MDVAVYLSGPENAKPCATIRGNILSESRNVPNEKMFNRNERLLYAQACRSAKSNTLSLFRKDQIKALLYLTSIFSQQTNAC